MTRSIFILFSSIFFSACGSSNGSDAMTSNLPENLNYQCTIEADDIEGCWLTTQCASGGNFSSKLIFEAEDGIIIRKAAVYASSNCTGQPVIETADNGELAYSYDSTILSSEGLETDMYQIRSGFTLVSIEQNTMCFSEGFYTVSSTHDLYFDTKANASLTVDFIHCFERI